MIDAYPLSWPSGWKRTPVDRRARAKFHRTERVYQAGGLTDGYLAKRPMSVSVATDRVLEELARFGVKRDSIIISTNVELRRDGLPRSGVEPDDPGVAVYWTDPATTQQQCMAIDVYDTVAGNLAAVAATIDAMRAIERHGGAQILNRAFQGFRALPASTTPAMSTEQAANFLSLRSPWAAVEILGDREPAMRAIRAASRLTHPDTGGSTAEFQLVQECKRVLEAHHGGPF